MLLNKIKKEIDKHKIISFDIFDTLLIRPYVKPTDLFLHLELLENCPGFCQARINAEKNAREHYSNLGDITIDEIYNEISSEFVALKSKELDLEAKILQPNPEIKEIFEYAKKQKKRVIIVSDMYLQPEFLIKLLISKGFKGFEKLFVSSQFRKTKWSGSLYKLILKELNISATDIFHIGDNETSDYNVPQKLNIKAFHSPKVIDKLFEINKRAKKFYENNSNNLGASILLGLLSLRIEEQHLNYWENFGFNYAGPVVYAYMQWLNTQLNKDKIKEAMFVARDGYTLEKVFNILKTSDIKTHYYYSPRILNLICNLNYKKNMELGEEDGLLAINAILNYFKKKDKWLSLNTPQIKNCSEGDNFIKRHIDLYTKLAKQEIKNYQKYFQQFNIQYNRIALIDTCSTFLSAQKALLIGLPNAIIKGYYWFTWEGTQEDIQQYDTETFQKSHKQEFIDWNIMELYMTAPTPPVEEIDKGNVIFKKITTPEQKRIDIYQDLSQGIVNFAIHCNQIFGKLKIFLTAELMIDFTNILCTIPTEDDKEHFKGIQHAWDVQHTQWVPLPKPWFNKLALPYKENTITNIFHFHLLGIPLLMLKKSPSKFSLFLFYIIPFVKWKKKINRHCFYIFNVPFYQIKRKGNKITFSLFQILPIISIKRK